MGSSSSSSKSSSLKHGTNHDSRISESQFYELEVTDICIRKNYIGNGAIDGLLSVPTYVLTLGTTVKHYWLVLEVKLTHDIKQSLGWH